MSLVSYFPDFFVEYSSRMVEICDNGIDDDGDGLIDINDEDCICKIIQPVSYIPNPSFEERNCCPSDRSQLNCATSWIQASQATTDFLHTCGWMGWPEFPPPRPFPDGEGVMGFRDGRVSGGNGILETGWKEYAGACLLRPLKANTLYLIEFDVGFVSTLRSPPINVTFFGTTDCANLPFGKGNDFFGCPTNGPGWQNLGSSPVSGNGENKWVKSSISIYPKSDIAAIAIGPDCPGVPSAVSIYYYFDNLILADFADFQFKISGTDQVCSKSFLLKIPERQGLTYQWYKDGIALLGEKSFRISKMYGEGNYQVRVLDGANCNLSGIYEYIKPVITNQVVTYICKDAAYTFGNRTLKTSGIYKDTFKTSFNCDSIVTLDLRVLGELRDTVNVKIFKGESYRIAKQTVKEQGQYEFNIKSSIGCDSLVDLNLEYYQIYFPNIFSPNDDGFNDIFTVFDKDGLIENVIFSIYDRWGTLIHSGQQWDGKLKNGLAITGVYTYIAKLRLSGGNERLFSGSLTLIK
ncbi:MAG: gliding motility-associated C-terminal domain-containing protein [Saprospiraceae bacterium]|nr:gliding motility-associated C-terminal domain-containing protein [Saprospiraceae bacterium]